MVIVDYLRVLDMFLCEINISCSAKETTSLHNFSMEFSNNIYSIYAVCSQ